MKRFILILVVFHFGMFNANAQKTISKKELRKQEKIKKLDAAIKVPKIKFGATKMSSSLGQNIGANGGLIYLKEDAGDLLEFMLLANNEHIKVSTQFKIENYTVVGSLQKGNAVIRFSGNINDSFWNFKLSVEKSRKATLLLNNNKGDETVYYGEVMRN